eukprot:CAMPEP_0180044932 /NCGR_PEP_ID=MMETSP0984-20121128/36183_1 /TAXON_ID=483367 /ORGANISM="non described non described, Strain CCMP 2436" /LENGTH=142 /DNA_ID=CAMNT_0021973125 /DNA_START=3 /DNA_END=430 /DNA_ORIENTATION=+
MADPAPAAESESPTVAPSRTGLLTRSRSVMFGDDKAVHLQVVCMAESYYVWAGDSGGRMDNLAAAIQTRFDTMPASRELIDGGGDTSGGREANVDAAFQTAQGAGLLERQLQTSSHSSSSSSWSACSPSSPASPLSRPSETT